MKSPTLSSAALRVAGFLALQAIVITCLAAAARYHHDQYEVERRLPALRPQPLTITPLYDFPEVVSDEQLQRVLLKLRPTFRGDKPKINHVDHALRLWGANAAFDDPACLSGQEMRELLLDHRKFAAAWPKTPSLLIFKGSGVKVRTQEGLATASHVDHTLAGLAEVGTPLSFSIKTPRGVATMSDLLEQSIRDFGLNQTEYEWSALAYALYVLPNQSWISPEGQEITFDRLARRLMRQSLNQGVCLGNHRLYTLAVLLRIDDEDPLLTTGCRQEVLAHLGRVTAVLVKSQHAYGYWDKNWPASGKASEGPEDTLQNRLLATGHALEWWAIAPPELQPPRETLVRAGQWLCRQVDEMSPEKIAANYTFLSHAGRALSLWRGHEAAHSLIAPMTQQQPHNLSVLPN
jgi:hypothetical protein